jgi:hypothetical protein
VAVFDIAHLVGVGNRLPLGCLAFIDRRGFALTEFGVVDLTRGARITRPIGVVKSLGARTWVVQAVEAVTVFGDARVRVNLGVLHRPRITASGILRLEHEDKGVGPPGVSCRKSRRRKRPDNKHTKEDGK